MSSKVQSNMMISPADSAVKKMQTYQLRLISRCCTIHLFPSLGYDSFTHDSSFEHRFRRMGIGAVEVQFELGWEERKSTTTY